MIAAAMLAIAIGAGPKLGEPIKAHFDEVEVNHFYDDEGRLTFSQVIWWNYDPFVNAHRVEAWRLFHHKHPPGWKKPDPKKEKFDSECDLPVVENGMWPRYNHRRGKYYQRWRDGEVERLITSDSFRRTWTQHDPELADREKFPVKSRRGLGGNVPE